MKKIITFVLSMILMLSVPMTASATGGDEIKSLNTNTDNSTREIEATYIEGEADAVYHVTVYWTTIDARYKAKPGVWDSDNLKYNESEEDGEWMGCLEINIVNRSNVVVHPFIEFESDYDTITSTWEEDGATKAQLLGVENNLADIIMESAAFEGVTEQNLPNIWMIGTFSGDLKSIVKDSNGTLNTENPIKIGTVKIALHGN